MPGTHLQRQLLWMQRCAGNAAVNQLLRQSLAPSSAAPARPSIQRHICGPSCGHLSPSSTQLSPTGSIELVHTDTDAAVQREVGYPPGPTRDPAPVQRHSSWEHRSLGDIEPEDLQIIAGGRDVAAGKTVDIPGKGAVDGANVLHVLEQELHRLETFRDHPPKDDSPASVQELQQFTKRADDDPLWDVRLLHVTFTTGVKVVVTYGEMNTLADLFGSPEEMKQTDPERFHQLVQGIRSQSYFNLLNLYNEIAGATNQEQRKSTGAFAGGVGSTGEQAPVLGEFNLMGITGRGKMRVGENFLPGTGKQETDYTAGLARNACHFAPESWHAWATYHLEARSLAQSAHAKQEIAEQLEAEAEALMQQGRRGDAAAKKRAADKPRKESQSEANEALLRNGFGDHFLQDSYAAGHLINKTQIMMWFVNWLEQHPEQRRSWTDDKLRRYMLMANQQSGLGVSQGRYKRTQPGQITARDAQSAENIEDDATTGVDWMTRFEALGLKTPDSIKPGSDGYRLLVWWQKASSSVQDGVTAKNAVKGMKPIYPHRTSVLLNQFVTDGIATRQANSDGDIFTLDSRYRVSWLNSRFTKATTPTRDEGEQENRDKSFTRMAAAVTYADYHDFLNNAFLQLSTNMLHNRYCERGLKVTDTVGGELFKVYGDDNMFQAESDKGVRHSGETARMSRDSIYALLQGQTPAKTPTEISGRFPNWVQPERLPSDNGEPPVVSLENWHTGGSLKRVCDDFVFPETANSIKGNALALKGGTSNKVSKDDIKAIHSGEAF
ncbi:MAG TPA: hypothetical protein VN837_00435 [Chloroflexota bacterium]|nr:hypothetical protein [Chloroflexota bacterium]